MKKKTKKITKAVSVKKNKKVAKKLTTKKPLKKKAASLKITRKKISRPAIFRPAISKKLFIQEVAETSAPIEKALAASVNFDLLEQEIDQLLDENMIEQPTEEIEKKVIDELIRMLPTDEAVVTSKTPRQTNIVIQNIRDRHEHSPYVLNLQELVRKKQLQNLRKQQAKQKINRYNWQPTVKDALDTDRYFSTINKLKPTTIKLPEPEIKRQFTSPKVLIAKIWIKPVLIFSLISLLVILPIKGFSYYKNLAQSKERIVTNSEKALADIKLAGSALQAQDAQLAEDKFSEAKLSFDQAQTELNSINVFLSSALEIVPTTAEYLTDAKRLTKAGSLLADTGKDLSKTIDKFYLKDNKTFTEKIIELQQTLSVITPKLKTASQEINQIDPKILPTDKRQEFTVTKERLQELTLSLDELNGFSNDMLEILGHQYKRRYLFVFQNNTEIRATGGFMGSLAVVDFYNGQIEKISLPGGGTYDFQGSLKENVQAPYPMQLINAKWELQDANWFFDYPTSAQKIEWFYEKAGGSSVDGVIAINASLMEKLLKHTQPIAMPKYNKIITADNFLVETQKSVELEYDKAENKPKQFLADLSPILLEQLFDDQKTDRLGVLQTLRAGLEQKDILLYFNNPNWQEKISAYDWSGEMKSTSKDYLAVVNTNIAGGKTDGRIKQTIAHNVEIDDAGLIFDTLTVKREHTGTKDELFSGVRNVNFMRVYVPQGSKLISATGFDIPAAKLFDKMPDYLKPDADLIKTETNKMVHEPSQTMIYDEADKTVFGNWTQTDPQEASTVIIKYQLPYKIQFQKTQPSFWDRFRKLETPTQLFSVFYQKQPGSLNTTVTSTISLPNFLKAVTTYPQLELSNNAFNYNFNFENDTLSGVVMSPN